LISPSVFGIFKLTFLIFESIFGALISKVGTLISPCILGTSILGICISPIISDK